MYLSCFYAAQCRSPPLWEPPPRFQLADVRWAASVFRPKTLLVVIFLLVKSVFKQICLYFAIVVLHLASNSLFSTYHIWEILFFCMTFSHSHLPNACAYKSELADCVQAVCGHHLAWLIYVFLALVCIDYFISIFPACSLSSKPTSHYKVQSYFFLCLFVGLSVCCGG